jgi:hypothetical protein
VIIAEDKGPVPRRTCREKENLSQKLAGFILQPLQRSRPGKDHRVFGCRVGSWDLEFADY